MTSLEDDGIPSLTFVEDVDIDAGVIEFESRTSRRLRGRNIASKDDAHAAYSTAAAPRELPQARKRWPARGRRQACTPAISADVLGDVDCNCRFSPGDSLYVHNYVAASRQGFAVSGGEYIQSTLSTCAHTVQALDADKSGAIDAADAKFLLQVIGQQRHFVSLNFTSTGTSGGVGRDNCTSLLSARIEGAGGTPPFAADYRVLFLFGPQTQTLVDFFNTSMESARAPVGSLVPFVNNTDQATLVYDRIWMLEGVMLEDEYSYGVAFPNTIDVHAMAVSLIVVTEAFLGNIGVLYAGIEANDAASAQYTPLDVDVALGGDTTVVRSVGAFGFNPRYARP